MEGNQEEEHIENKQLKFENIGENQSEDNLVQIKICVTDPIEKDSGVHKYIVYSIKGSDKDGPFETFRRYSDFNVLKKFLVKRWPGCFVPAIPEKKAVGNMDAKFIEERRSMLEKFCVQMAQLPHLYYSEEFKIFLRQTNVDVEKALNAMQEQSSEELIQKYQVNFKQLSGKEINTELVLKINSFQNYLKKVSTMLGNFKEMAKNAGKARKDFNDKFGTLAIYLMPEYEKNCLTEYANSSEDRMLFINPTDHTLDIMLAGIKENFKLNSFEDLSFVLKAEANDIASFQESFAQKHNYEVAKEKIETKLKELNLDLQKLLAGKTSIAGFFSKGTKEEKVTNLEKQIASAKADLENVQFVCDIITVIVGYIEIDRFKGDKLEKYYKIVKSMAKFEVEYAKAMQEYWSHVGSNFNLSQIE